MELLNLINLIKAKCVIRAMDKVISDHVAWDDWTAWEKIMKVFFTEGIHEKSLEFRE